jgi:hypothetical protein
MPTTRAGAVSSPRSSVSLARLRPRTAPSTHGSVHARLRPRTAPCVVCWAYTGVGRCAAGASPSSLAQSRWLGRAWAKLAIVIFCGRRVSCVSYMRSGSASGPQLPGARGRPRAACTAAPHFERAIAALRGEHAERIEQRFRRRVQRHLFLGRRRLRYAHRGSGLHRQLSRGGLRTAPALGSRPSEQAPCSSAAGASRPGVRIQVHKDARMCSPLSPERLLLLCAMHNIRSLRLVLLPRHRPSRMNRNETCMYAKRAWWTLLTSGRNAASAGAVSLNIPSARDRLRTRALPVLRGSHA